jgi:hypothetical protein
VKIIKIQMRLYRALHATAIEDVRMAAEHLEVLQQNPKEWKYFITGDGRWIY